MVSPASRVTKLPRCVASVHGADSVWDAPQLAYAEGGEFVLFMGFLPGAEKGKRPLVPSR